MRSLTGAMGELRRHPARYVAVLAAIALSVGFLVGILTFVETQKAAMGRAAAAHTMNVDVVVNVSPDLFTYDKEGKPTFHGEPLVKALTGLEGTESEELLSTSTQIARDGLATWTQVVGMPRNPGFGWVTPAEGRLPENKNEVTLSSGAQRTVEARVGDTVQVGTENLKVVGIDDTSAFMSSPVIYLHHTAALFQPDPEHPEYASSPTLLLRATDGSDPEEVASRAREAVNTFMAGFKAPAGMAEPEDRSETTVRTGSEERQERVSGITADMDQFALMLLAFGVIAVLVGAIIVSTTFGILMTQRRRQIGLLRAVGALRGQVWRRFVVEAVAIGVIGSLLGVAAGMGMALLATVLLIGTPSAGLVVPWAPTAGAVVVGVIFTVLAAMRPIRQATSVPPLEALRPVNAAEKQHRTSRALVIVSIILAMLGAAAAIGAVTFPIPEPDPQNYESARTGAAFASLSLALLAGVLITAAVFASATVYMPILLRAAGRLLKPLGPIPRMSALNAARNPGRAAATSIALMLAIGLISTILVAMWSLQATAIKQMDDMYPVELMAQSWGEDDVLARVDPGKITQLEGIAGADVVRSADVGKMPDVQEGPSESSEHDPFRYFSTTAVDPGSPALTSVPEGLSDGTLLIPGSMLMRGQKAPATITVQGAKGDVTLKVRVSKGSIGGTLVTPATFDRLADPETVRHEVWARTVDPGNPTQAVKSFSREMQSIDPDLNISGSVHSRATMMEVFMIFIMVVVGLLGMAALIALIGVGNTLGLSVLERTRESAILRALGLQATGLRWMLVAEALLLTLVGTLIGVSAGIGFGSLAAWTVIRQMELEAQVSIPWLYLLGVVGVAAVAAIIASVAPGHKAAKAAPVEALADEG